MVTWQSSTFIARSPRDVFEYVADVRNDPNWHTDVNEARIIRENGSVEEGTVFEVRARMSGTLEVVVYDAPHEVVLESGDMGKMAVTDTRTVTPVEDGVQVTRRVDAEATGLMGLVMKMMVGMAAKRNDRFVQNLREVLEGP